MPALHTSVAQQRRRMATRLSMGIVGSVAVLPWFANGGGLQKGGGNPHVSAENRRKYAGINRLQEQMSHTFCQWFSGRILTRSLGGPVFPVRARAPPSSLYPVLTLVDFDVDLR